MGKISTLLNRRSFFRMGVGVTLAAGASNAIFRVYPLTAYHFISEGTARTIFWCSVAIGVFGIICISIAAFRHFISKPQAQVEINKPRKTGIRMQGGKGKFRNTKIRNMDVGIETTDTDLEAEDTDIE